HGRQNTVIGKVAKALQKMPRHFPREHLRPPATDGSPEKIPAGLRRRFSSPDAGRFVNFWQRIRTFHSRMNIVPQFRFVARWLITSCALASSFSGLAAIMPRDL